MHVLGGLALHVFQVKYHNHVEEDMVSFQGPGWGTKISAPPDVNYGCSRNNSEWCPHLIKYEAFLNPPIHAKCFWTLLGKIFVMCDAKKPQHRICPLKFPTPSPGVNSGSSSTIPCLHNFKTTLRMDNWSYVEIRRYILSISYGDHYWDDLTICKPTESENKLKYHTKERQVVYLPSIFNDKIP